MDNNDLDYMSGFGNHFESEALKNTLPKGQNSPQVVKNGLYAEQINGSAFTMPRNENKRSWLYKINPSVKHSSFKPYIHRHIADNLNATPSQLRWDPLKRFDTNIDFIDGLFLIAGGGDPESLSGLSVYWYYANKEMKNRAFYSADGEFLIVPQEGNINIQTEMGLFSVKPGEIIVIPRGIKFSVSLISEYSKGYVCENFGSPFTLPNLGPIGSNGLANPRDFLYPVAHFEDRQEEHQLISKFCGTLWDAAMTHSPFDVVAWHGNYAPYKYDLSNFNVMNTVSFDHADPSIFTVLTSPSEIEGMANVDFVIFPPRWSVAEDTFRPPYYHRNIMSEFMGLIKGEYDAKSAKGFQPGGFSLHNCMSAHGPDKEAFESGSSAELKPTYMKDTLAFMFESKFIIKPTSQSLHRKELQKNYNDCWKDLEKHFSPT
jgi:homogentisate 1,2-dioxygenase